jgi:hypothetical protein
LQKWITAKPYAQSPPALGLVVKTQTESSERFFTVLQLFDWRAEQLTNHKLLFKKIFTGFSCGFP